jgi:hypothetical protein
LRFYEELNRFLPRADRKKNLGAVLPHRTSVGNAIRRLGVPLDEVDLILVNGEPAGFDRPLGGGDRVSVYPEFERLDVGPLTRLPGRPLRRPRFIASEPDLASLAARLQEMGYDVRFDPSLSVEELTGATRHDRRILLTSAPDLPAGAERAVQVPASGDAGTQTGWVLEALDLSSRGR